MAKQIFRYDSLLLLTILFLLSLCICGCTTSSSNTNNESTILNPDEVIFPLDDKVTLTVFVPERPNTDDYTNNMFTQYIEELTNIELEFIVSDTNKTQEELALKLATGDYPDIIMGGQLNTTLQAFYGEQKVLIPLNDYIDKYGTNTRNVFEQYPIAREVVSKSDGNIYNLPKISDCFHCKSSQKLWIYEPWLEKLGLSLPTTTEEFREVLQAFKTLDPNGNGFIDEIPFAGATRGWETHVEAFIMNSFTYYGRISVNGTFGFYVENDIVKASYIDEGWQEGLIYLQSLAKDGLLAKESFTQAEDGLRSMGNHEGDVILGAFSAGSPAVVTDIAEDRWLDYIAVPPLLGPEDIRYASYEPYKAVLPGFSITDKCENPAIAFALADLLYDETITLNSTIGLEGYAWQYVNDDNKFGINGEKALWEVLDPYSNQTRNISWQQVGNSYKSSMLRLGRYEPDSDSIEVKLYQETKNKYEPYYPSVIKSLPNLAFSEEQFIEILTYESSINTYVNKKKSEYVVSNIDIKSDWQNYIEELESLGLSRLLELHQEVYDEQYRDRD